MRRAWQSGYARGSHLATHKAAEIGHFFFAEGSDVSLFSGLWATHPPLDARIRAVDPQWDGKFYQPPEPVDVARESFVQAGLVRPKPAEIKRLLDLHCVGQNHAKKTLAVALKGSSEDMKNHVFKTMSSRASQMLKEDMEALGPVRSREVATAQQDIVQQARKLEADGKLTLKSSGDDAYVV